MSNLIPAFQIKLGQQIQSGLVVVGKFDGKTPSLACGTTGGKVLLHSPHEASLNTENQLPSIRFLNFNRKISSLASGSLGTLKTNSAVGDERDLLFVGTESTLLAYDVERNADVFFRDVQDGVNSLLVGKLAHISKPLVIAGGNCSVVGFDKEGNEAFWTVTGDNISSLELCDIDGDGQEELLVGSDDFEIRIFRNEDLLSDISEADKVSFLKTMAGTKFGYGLVNGTLGVYNNKTRLWRVKTKTQITSLESYDLDHDGVNEVISGWNNGMFNVRNIDTGEIIFKETLSSPIASIVHADYRMDGKSVLMVCSESGDVKGYLPVDAELVTMSESGVEIATEEDQKALSELQAKKLQLTNELRQLEKSLKAVKSGDVMTGALPSNTTLNYTLVADDILGKVTLTVEASTDVHISCLIAVDLEGVIFEGREVLAISPPILGKTATLPFYLSKNQRCLIRLQTHIAVKSIGSQLHVFEADIEIPTFASFKKIENEKDFSKPSSHVIFKLNESTARLCDWINSVFMTPTPVKMNLDKLKVCFVCVNKGNEPLHILASRQEGEESCLIVKVLCERIELASEIIQDIARYFKITELDSEADFPNEMLGFKEVTNQVADYTTTRSRLAADMADDSQRVKALIVRAEDSRLINEMDTMRRSYTELYSMNNQLIGGYNLRASNHNGLLVALKEVNQMIQRAANLRVGKAKTTVVTDCRAAVKANNMKALFRIIKSGRNSTTINVNEKR